MKNYKTTANLRLHAGRLRLTKEQAQARAHMLESVDGEIGIYEIKGYAEFKAGEVFGFDGDVPKTKADAVTVVTDDGENDGIAADKIQRICDAIAVLDPEDKDQFTNAGLPQVGAIEAVLSEDITAAERDAAWAQYQTDSK